MKEKPLRNQAGQTLEEFLAAYHPGDYPHPSVTVDLIVISVDPEPELLLIRRGNHPHLGEWALPGGFVEPGEFTEAAAARELQEETHAEGLNLTSVGFFSGPDRDPRCWTMSHAFLALTRRSELSLQADDDAADVGWFRLQYSLFTDHMELILSDKEESLTAKVELKLENTAIGEEWKVSDFTSDGIAFDHAKMIAAAILRLQQAGRPLQN